MRQFLTGLLNSKLVYFWLKNKGKLQGDQLQIDKEPLLGIPICISNKAQQKSIIILVEKMIYLNKEFHEILKYSEKWKLLKSEIDKTDHQIDKLVYNIYGLLPEEIKIIEAQTNA